jgi:hypothetical protein
MVGTTFNDWMLGLPVILQLMVAFAVLFTIGLIPLVMWLGYAVTSTPDVLPGRRDGAKP